MAETVVFQNPYIGPRPFETQHRERFFGREREIHDFYSNVMSSRVVILNAKSGTGKTSLLNAGLIPKLEEEPFEILPIARVRGLIPDDIPIADVKNPFVLNALISWSENQGDVRDLLSMSMYDFLRERPVLLDKYNLPMPRLLIFDQFEEFFGFYGESRELRRAFFDDLNASLTYEYPEHGKLLRVVFIIREDYIAEMTPYENLLVDRVKPYRIEFMTPQAALSAVEKPLEGTSREYAPGVAQKLVEELSQREEVTEDGQTKQVHVPFVEPVQLQVVCRTLWDNLPSDIRVIDDEQLEKFGDVDSALTAFYENAIKETIEQTGVDEELLRNWFSATTLITANGRRGSVFQDPHMDELAGLPKEAVAMLENKFLIRGETRTGGRLLELTHDRLVQPILTSNTNWKAERERSVQVEELERKDVEIVELATRSQGLRNLAIMLGVAVVIASLVGVAFSLLQLQNANQAQATAVANQEAAITAQGIAELESANAAQQAATATVAQGNAENSAATAAAQATDSAIIAATSDSNAATAIIAQGQAENSAATAAAQATDSAVIAATSIANAATAVVAQQDAESASTDVAQQAATATVAQGQAEDSAATAEFVQILAENLALTSDARAADLAIIAATSDSNAATAVVAQEQAEAINTQVVSTRVALQSTVDAQNESLGSGGDTDDATPIPTSVPTRVVINSVDLSLDDLEDEDFDIEPYSLANLEIPDFTLISEEDGFIEVKVLGITITDFMVDVTVENPDIRGYWDYGFLFRMDGTGEYRVLVNDESEWSLVLRDESEFITVDQGSLSDFEDGRGDENRIRLITFGEEGLLVVNDEVIELDLSDKTAPGDIFISIEIGGSFDEEEIPVTMSETVLWAIGAPGDNQFDDEAEGELDSSDDVEEWWYRGDADDVINIEATSEDDVATRIFIYDSFGTPVRVSSDNSRDALIESFILPSTGYYRILIDSPSGDRGEYAIRVNDSDFATVDLTEIDEDDAFEQVDVWDSGETIAEEDEIEIPHNSENGFIETFRLRQNLANFLIEVTVINPYDFEDEGRNWDYGFLFRDGTNQDYYLIFEPQGRWELWLRFTDTDLDIFESKRISSGTIDDWDDDEGDENDIMLGAYNNVGILFVNGEFIAVLDLSDNVMPGDLEVVTGFDTNAEIDGESTVFEDISVWEATTAEELGFVSTILDVDEDELYDLAFDAFLEDDYDLAVDLYTQFIDTQEEAFIYEVAFSYYLRGISYYYLEDFELAIEDLTVVLEDYEDSGLTIADIYGWRAFASYANGNDLEDVLEDHETAFELGLTDFFIYADYAMVLFGLEREEDAFEAYQTGIDNDDRLLYQYGLDVEYEEPLGNVDNYGIVLARDTENFAPLMVRAAAYAYGGEFDSAIEEYEAALDAAPDFAPIYAALGDIYYELEDFDEALAYYETYIELADDDAREDVVERYEELEE